MDSPLFEKALVESVADHDDLVSIYGAPQAAIVDKVSTLINDDTAVFISSSPLIFMSTHSRSGRCDVTPRGGAPGFVKQLDETVLAIPDVPGNRRLDSMHNILTTGRAGLFFVIPGRADGLRTNGRACVTRDAEILARFDPEPREVKVAILIDVDEVFVHCSAAFSRGNVWNPDQWPTTDSVPTMMQLWKSHLRDNGVGE